MNALKILTIVIFAIALIASCAGTKAQGYSIVASKDYDASLFRQNCAICHGPEGDGKTLDDGTKVPSLRHGEFKFHTPAEIRKQISDGGNGMSPFRSQLTDREMELLVGLVHDKLRK